MNDDAKPTNDDDVGEQDVLTEPQIRGFRVRNFGPIRQAFVGVHQGVNVLYGKNGAGKTRLLQAICAAMSDPDRHSLEDQPADSEVVAYYYWPPPKVDPNLVFGASADELWRWKFSRGNPWSETSPLEVVIPLDDPTVDFEVIMSGPKALSELAREHLSLTPPETHAAQRVLAGLRPTRESLGSTAHMVLEMVRSGRLAITLLADGKGGVRRQLHPCWSPEDETPVTDHYLDHFRDMYSRRTIRDVVGATNTTSGLKLSDVLRLSDMSPERGAKAGLMALERAQRTWGDCVNGFGLGVLKNFESIFRERSEQIVTDALTHGHELGDVACAEDLAWYALADPPVWAWELSTPFTGNFEGPPLRLVTEPDEESYYHDSFAFLLDPKYYGEGWEWEAARDRSKWHVAIDDESGEPALQPEVLSRAADLSAKASAVYADLFESSMELRLVLAPPSKWSFEPFLRWEIVSVEGRSIPVEDLSEAERRWAGMSISLAAYCYQEAPLIVLDEPERSLHRSAERHLVQGLSRLVDRMGGVALIASHSPAFLRFEAASLLHVKRDSGGFTVVETMSSDMRRHLDELGLDRSDLLQLCRTVLLVEGAHDQYIIEEFLGVDVLERLGVAILVLRGARTLRHAADAQLLLRFSEARMIVVLDNLNNEKISRIWDEARDAAKAGQDHHAVLSKLTSKKDGVGDEAKYLQEFCSLAISQGEEHRFDIFTFEKPDIPEYLRPRDISRDVSDESWSDLRKMAGDKARTSTGFKNWMEKNKSADYSEASLRAAARSMPQHADFSKLYELLTRRL